MSKLAPLVLAVLASASHAQLLSTAFTYQGELTEAGAPAAGLYDFQFTLFNRDLNTQVGPTVCADNVVVVDGRFALQLDFGVSPAEADHDLQLQVRRDTGLLCGNLAGFTTLGPNQPVTAAPMALTSKRAADSDRLGGQLPSFYTSAASITTGTLSDARLSTNVPRMNSASAQTFTGPLSFSGSTQFTSMSVQNITINGGTLAGNGAGITGIAANNLATGTLNDARLSANIPRLNAANTFTQNSIFSNALSVGGNLSVGGTLTADAVTLAAPVARTLTLSPLDFGQGGIIVITSEPMLLTNTAVTGPNSAFAPIHLPQGASITALRVNGEDDASNSFTVSLVRRDLNGGGGGTVAGVTSNTNSAGDRVFSDTTISAPVVDNANFFYFVRVDIEPTSIGTLLVRSVRVEYTVTNPVY